VSTQGSAILRETSFAAKTPTILVIGTVHVPGRSYTLDLAVAMLLFLDHFIEEDASQPASFHQIKLFSRAEDNPA
jgi:hypothetical protein